MRALSAFLSLIAMTVAVVITARSGLLPPWAAMAVIASSGAVVGTIVFREVAASLNNCELCKAPLRDRCAAGAYALKYGVRVCTSCGRKLDERFRDDEPRDHPSFPPYMP